MTPQEKVVQALAEHDARQAEGLSWRQGVSPLKESMFWGGDATAMQFMPPRSEQEWRDARNQSTTMTTGIGGSDAANLQWQQNYWPALQSWLKQQVAPLGGYPIEPITPR